MKPSTMSAVTISEIAAALERWAPRGSALSYDNVGLQVGDGSRVVDRVLIALDLTHGVVEEAAAFSADLIITHHPLIFKPLKGLRPEPGPGGLAYELVRRDLALYCIHTNLDAAPGGVSFALGEQLGLTDLRLLSPYPEQRFKLVTFVPESHAEAVRESLARAGAGVIGDYTDCSFELSGHGFFRPGKESKPFIGRLGGDLQRVAEHRIEIEVDRWDLDRATAALREAHPYEEVPCDVYPVQQASTRFGLGAVGRLPEPEALSDFLQRTATRLGTPALRFAGDLTARVERVAVAGGSCSEFLEDALRAGADAFVTADIKYHQFFDVYDAKGHPRIAFIDAGHYETEQRTENMLHRYLTARFPTVSCKITGVRTSAMQVFIAS